MKKIILILLVLLAVMAGCTSTKKAKEPEVSLQKQTENVLFEYTALTRGAYKKVIVSSYNIVTIKDRDNKDAVSRKLTADEWKTLYDAYKTIKDPGTLSSIEAPSVKHQYDGALVAMVTITVDDVIYQTNTFDHGNPPAEVKPLVDAIIKFSGLNEPQ
ncbi:hypothetical protein GR160_09325 [Flavobacterium sp. Sd200]|uniref:hypothetical protein n=1 Tax=Flavobacterium sp. Sd200 TaxID=2692211 RepID=UPI0013722DCB|nr:hypothetical protein [Flavobacterium sp. Sd200]MXN91429.1 hypothetical protein [Flavobacterium sp. Sd200]